MFFFAAFGAGLMGLEAIGSRERRLEREREAREDRKYEYRQRIQRQEAKLRQKREAMRVDENLANFSAVAEHVQSCMRKQVSSMPDVTPTEKRSFAVVGNTCVGKTTQLNAVFSLNLKACPLRNTSNFTKVATTDALDVYDVFGMNNRETYVHMQTLMAIKAVHIIACMYTDCVESVLDLAKLLQALRSNSREPFTLVFVRNKMDTVEAGYHGMIYDNDFAELRKICPDCKLVQTSNITGMGLDKLKAILDIGDGRY
jgi:predicted GTPase